MPTTNKNPRIYARQFLHSPQENIWPALRAAKEKAAHSGDNFRSSFDLVRVQGVEPWSQPWEGYIIAVIRHPR